MQYSKLISNSQRTFQVIPSVTLTWGLVMSFSLSPNFTFSFPSFLYFTAPPHPPFLKQGFSVAPADMELAMWIRLAQISGKYTCFCLQSAEIMVYATMSASIFLTKIYSSFPPSPPCLSLSLPAPLSLKYTFSQMFRLFQSQNQYQ